MADDIVPNQGPQSADDITRRIHDDLYDALRAVESSDLTAITAADLASIASFAKTVRQMLSVAPVLEPQGIGDAIRDQLDDVRRLAEGTPYEYVSNRLADELEAELETPASSVGRYVGQDRIYDGGYDDLTLTFERIDTLALAINDAVMMDENRNLVALIAMVRHYLRDADRIASENAKRWN